MKYIDFVLKLIFRYYPCGSAGVQKLVNRIQDMASGPEFTETVFLPSGESISIYQCERHLQEAKYNPKLKKNLKNISGT